MTVDPVLSDVVEIASRLIRIDTSNYGDDTGPGERRAAEYVCALLDEVGLSAVLLEPSPTRTNVVLDVPGTTGQPALLVHAHLDTVPTDSSGWRLHPHAGEVLDGELHGRGAVDMKHFAAMILAVLRRRAREGRRPSRPLRVVFTADEEAGGTLGAHWLVSSHPELVADCTEAVGEVGGFSVTIGSRRLYLVETGERGMAWLRLNAHGRAGHGSMHHPDNAVLHLARAITAIGDIPWPLQLDATGRQLLAVIAQLQGDDSAAAELVSVEQPTDEHVRQVLTDALGPAARMVLTGMRNSANATMLRAGYKHNVIPDRAEARVDGRFLPDQREALIDEITQRAGHQVEVVRDFVDVAVESPIHGPLTGAMKSALELHDPGSTWAPYQMPGGSDAKAWSRLGIRCYGFTPLRLPPTFDFSKMFHGVDERVPIDALTFGADVLDSFFDLA